MADIQEQTPAPGSKTDTTPDKIGQQQTPGSDAGEAKLTQAQFEALMKERLTRDREAREKEFLTAYGVASRDELKTKLDAAAKLEESQLSEQQKVTKALEKEKADREAAQKELQALREASKQEKLDNAIGAAAKGAHDPDEIVMHIRKDAGEALAKAMNADGVIDAKAIEPLIADLKKKKAYLFGGQTPGSPSNHGGRAPEPDAKAKEVGKALLRRQILNNR